MTEELNVTAAPEIEIEVPSSGCPKQELVFNAKAKSSQSKTGNLLISWDFGDGQIAEGNVVKHTYTQGGNYTVKAKVVDTSLKVCNTAFAQKSIKINSPPQARAGENIIRCFPASQPTLEVKFDGTSSSDADGDTLTYYWDFGDGVTSNLARPIHVYRKSGKYKVRLTVKDNSPLPCNTSEDAIDVILNHPPIADAGGDRTCCLNEPVLFSASRSSDPDGDPLTYTWDFGDGTTGQGKEVTHTYNKPGEYKVTLVVSDNFAQSDCKSSTAGFIANVKQAPVAVMNIKPYYSTEGE
ncbi:MAG: PKD domain-containing protein [Candidatus Omnitrophica bacterium]|nr:PKD domain-containing protein [Candidatus Omnitrophota bacterium]